MGIVGLNVDPRGRAHVPTVVASGATLVRLVLAEWDAGAGTPLDCLANVRRYVDAGLAVLGVFAAESLADRAGEGRAWDDALRAYAATLAPLLWGLQAGNEYSNPPGGASWTMTAAQQSLLHRLAAYRFRDVNPGVLIVSGAIGTGQPDDLAALDLSMCDLAGVHLYDERVDYWPSPTWGNGDADELLARFEEASSRPLAITEWSTTDAAAAPEYIVRSAARYRAKPYVALDCYFRYADRPGEEPFGLFGPDDRPTARWDAFKEANAMPDPQPDNTVAWEYRWQRERQSAVYRHDFGLETTWRAHVDEWGYPIGADGEQPFVMQDGSTRSGRVFSRIGIVVWDDKPVVLGWP